jgi:hypothetical protein
LQIIGSVPREHDTTWYRDGAIEIRTFSAVSGAVGSSNRDNRKAEHLSRMRSGTEFR